jgi:hypothetical protein
MEKSKGETMIQREINQIDKAVWETTKCIILPLEEENDELDLEFFYMPPKSLSQPISKTIESCMKEDHGRKCSKILLDFHETIIGQVLNVGCACSCHPRSTRKLFNKVFYFGIHFNVSE